MKKVPVKKEGVEVGYTLDNGKTIHFYDTPEAKKVVEMINSGEPIGVSSRKIGEVIEGRYVKPIDSIDFSILENAVFNECVESDDGTWEFFRESNSDIFQLQYWLPDGDHPLVTLKLSEKEFNDLESLFSNIKKYRSNE